MTGPVRLVGLLGALSLACDAADGFPHETTMRSTVLAAGLARTWNDDRLTADVVVGALLRHIGCTAFSAEEAHRYGAGDDVALRNVMAEVDFGRPERAGRIIGERLHPQSVAALAEDGPAAGARHDAAQCDAAERLVALLPVSPGAATVASDAFERWDGHGGPRGKAGDEISLVSRIVEVAYVAELFRGRQGRAGAVAELRARRGGQLDPVVTDRFVEHAAELFDALDDPRRSVWDQMRDAEPAPHSRVSPVQLDDVALAFARFADLKSTWLAGHSEHVAALAVDAGRALDLDPAELHELRRAALLHDIGTVGVPTGILDLARPLSANEEDRMRFHSWETHRILSSTPLLQHLADAAGDAHERIDGSGYHRGRKGNEIGTWAAVIAAVDVWCGLRSDHPQRAAIPLGQARDELAAMAAEGLLQRSAVGALLDAAEAAPLPGARWPAGLTDREVDVLLEVATGATNKQVASTLGITPRTVAHHVEHLYDKIGVRSRAGATLFALEHGLIARHR